MSLVLQSCRIEENQDIIPTVKQLPGVRPKISQDDTENPGSHRHRSRSSIEGMKFTGKREREKEKQETSLIPKQAKLKRRKLGSSEDENISSEDKKEITDTKVCDRQDESVGQQRSNTSSPMNLVTFFKAISESNKARTAIKEEAKRVSKEKGKEWNEEEDDDKDGVLENIFQHLPPKTIINLTETTTDLYKFFNDCQEIGLVGVDNINPSTCFNPYKIRNYCYSDFDKVTYTPEKIPSVPFGRIMQQVSDLPKSYWPYIDKTNISVISLAATGIINDDFIYLWECLQNSKVKELDLSYNEITDEIAERITELPKSISKVILFRNQLTEVGKSRLQANYPNVTWIF